jgi:UDP-N-acetylglucosamine--N-acetylmuramyl-(pentapeptide) pyrophosphoryl-undecaprenol N-acetylglucosamine transferase
MVTAANVRDLARVPLGVIQAAGFVRRFGPDAVLSTGGYVAVPVCLAARWAHRPLVVHEQTTRLGLANRIAKGARGAAALADRGTLHGHGRPGW